MIIAADRMIISAPRLIITGFALAHLSLAGRSQLGDRLGKSAQWS
jgi:hypothetical protein